MNRLLFVLALLGPFAGAARAEGIENLPASIAIKAGVPVAKLQAAGAQIYMCAKNTAGALVWTFRELSLPYWKTERQWAAILSAQRGNSSMGRELWAKS